MKKLGIAGWLATYVLALVLIGCGGGSGGGDSGADQATLRDANLVYYSMPG